jgi:hypothetical protein
LEGGAFAAMALNSYGIVLMSYVALGFGLVFLFELLLLLPKEEEMTRRIAISACQLRAERKPYLADVLWLRVRVGGVGGESALRVGRRETGKWATKMLLLGWQELVCKSRAEVRA